MDYDDEWFARELEAMREARERPVNHVYRCFDGAGALLYVGVTKNMKRRLAGHASKAAWWSLVERTETEGPYGRDDALDREGEVIDSERPRFNIKGRDPAQRGFSTKTYPSRLSPGGGTADTSGSKPEVREGVRVRVPPRAPGDAMKGWTPNPAGLPPRDDDWWLAAYRGMDEDGYNLLAWYVEALRESGWTIEPPKAGQV